MSHGHMETMLEIITHRQRTMYHGVIETKPWCIFIWNGPNEISNERLDHMSQGVIDTKPKFVQVMDLVD